MGEEIVETVRFKHQKIRWQERGSLLRMVMHAHRTAQVDVHKTKTLDKILNCSIVTICELTTDLGRKSVGYSFYRPAPGTSFSKAEGRWRAESRARLQLGIAPSERNPTITAELEKNVRKQEMRRLGLERQRAAQEERRRVELEREKIMGPGGID